MELLTPGRASSCEHVWWGGVAATIIQPLTLIDPAAVYTANSQPLCHEERTRFHRPKRTKRLVANSWLDSPPLSMQLQRCNFSGLPGPPIQASDRIDLQDTYFPVVVLRPETRVKDLKIWLKWRNIYPRLPSYSNQRGICRPVRYWRE